MQDEHFDLSSNINKNQIFVWNLLLHFLYITCYSIGRSKQMVK